MFKIIFAVFLFLAFAFLAFFSGRKNTLFQKKLHPKIKVIINQLNNNNFEKVKHTEKEKQEILGLKKSSSDLKKDAKWIREKSSKQYKRFWILFYIYFLFCLSVLQLYYAGLWLLILNLFVGLFQIAFLINLNITLSKKITATLRRINIFTDTNYIEELNGIGRQFKIELFFEILAIFSAYYMLYNIYLYTY
ncbi:hypothetical protein [Liquorilactobacillus capillatus]|uniref:Uncharacterized protein n=2 Tax=Liquorilactobacillus capillatus TaxID=480931 RepID=A0A0R1MCS9_9LACO|nr:hypothetical protein [Liquorilactobacillus capillatus]AJA33863.1 hypothetical protein [Liquorilactobacillus capillatus]KRL02075.1 hypothetical protein FC81_GL000838 [Liquorilactobacillus capillatus DSM 19910]